MHTSLKVLTLGLGFALAACNGEGSTSSENNFSPIVTDNLAADTMAVENSAGNVDSTQAMAAQQFADTAAASDAYELESSKLAIDKAMAADVKNFAQQMVKDHTDSTAKLKAAARSVVPNAEMSLEQRSNLQTLRNATGDAFDKAYIAQQRDAHQMALDALSAYAENGEDAALKAHAAATAPVVKGHLDMLQKM